MRKFKTQLIITISFLALTSCTVFGDVSVKVAPYKVTAKDGVFELRQYEKLVLVSTEMPGGMESASDPFRRLFDYISGKNVKTEKIAMTAPVFMDQAGNNSETMSFVLPKEFALLSAPIPLDSSVKLTELTNYTVAVITYNGFLSQKTILAKTKLLKRWVNKKGLKINGGAKAAGYNPPFTLPFLRRNEIFLPVEISG
jgi:hypothetical protein